MIGGVNRPFTPQIFHLLVVAAAFVHYHGISEMALHRLVHGEKCTALQQASSSVY
jgi:hypothetical protein